MRKKLVLPYTAMSTRRLRDASMRAVHRIATALALSLDAVHALSHTRWNDATLSISLDMSNTRNVARS